MQTRHAESLTSNANNLRHQRQHCSLLNRETKNCVYRSSLCAATRQGAGVCMALPAWPQFLCIHSRSCHDPDIIRPSDPISLNPVSFAVRDHSKNRCSCFSQARRKATVCATQRGVIVEFGRTERRCLTAQLALASCLFRRSADKVEGHWSTNYQLLQ